MILGMVHLWTEGPSLCAMPRMALATGDCLALNQPQAEVLLPPMHPPWCCSAGGGLVMSEDPDFMVFRGGVAVCRGRNNHSLIMQIASRKTKVHM